MQKIIRDEQGFGIFMMPLFVDWNIRRCNIKGCTNRPSTIITDIHPQVSVAGLCEDHYQACVNDDGTLSFNETMTFDDFDAFKAVATEEGADE